MIEYAYNATNLQQRYEIVEINNNGKVNILKILNFYSTDEIEKLYNNFIKNEYKGLNIILENGTLYKNAVLLLKINNEYCFIREYFKSILRFIQRYDMCLIRNKNMNNFDSIKNYTIYEIESS